MAYPAYLVFPRHLDAGLVLDQVVDPEATDHPDGTAVCLYDDAGSLVAGMAVDRAGDFCGSKPCWAVWKPTGFQYKDCDEAPDGVSRIKLGGGLPGKTQLFVKASNGAGTLPVPIAASLPGATSATVQLIGYDPVHTPLCFEATLDDIKKQDATQFKAVGS
ncbi:MAG: hypothetical protein P8R42_06250 [Candidatus Binatia bacterium]|nr:hypothetical protein [Candidatus Binatia bacterium]